MQENTQNPDTRERILDVAEYEFMSYGYEGTSMRMITSKAEVNLAAINYHFGSKEGLLREVFRRRLDWLNSERLTVLDALEEQANGAPLKPSQILEAFFGTLLRIGHLVGRLQPGKGAFGDHHGVATAKRGQQGSQPDPLGLGAADGILEQALATDFRQRIALQIEELVVGRDTGVPNQHGFVQLFSESPV